MRCRPALLLVPVLAFGPLVLAGCAADTVALPDVVGLPLDEAHRTLEALGIEEFDDRDKFEDRTIVRDANWVVVSSSPKSGEAVELDATVVLEVGKRDEARAVSLLPPDSPVARDFAAEQEREQRAERERQEQAAADEEAADQRSAELLVGYINEVDPVLRLTTNVFGEVDATADGVRRQIYGYGQAAVVSKAVDATNLVNQRVAGLIPPQGSRRAGTHEALTAATARWTEAARTLNSADGVGREGSLARFEQVRTEARNAWNAALTDLYRGTDVVPPLLP
jgi:hypothetical protein